MRMCYPRGSPPVVIWICPGMIWRELKVLSIDTIQNPLWHDDTLRCTLLLKWVPKDALFVICCHTETIAVDCIRSIQTNHISSKIYINTYMKQLGPIQRYSWQRLLIFMSSWHFAVTESNRQINVHVKVKLILKFLLKLFFTVDHTVIFIPRVVATARSDRIFIILLSLSREHK